MENDAAHEVFEAAIEKATELMTAGPQAWPGVERMLAVAFGVQREIEAASSR